MMTPEQIAMARQKRIIFPTPKPLFTAPPNQDALAKWVVANSFPHLPHSASIAKKIASNIYYITFDEFMALLKRTIADFNARCDKPYVLWLAQDVDYIFEHGCSELWVAGLALEDCDLRWPEAIVTSRELPSYLAEHTEIESVLLLDDAAYRGFHLHRELTSQHKWLTEVERAVSIYIGIPFVSEAAEEIVRKKAEEHPSITFQLLAHQVIFAITHYLSEDEQAEIRSLPHHQVSLFVTLTYFQHKLPDHYSTLRLFDKGLFFLDTYRCLVYKQGIKPRTDSDATVARRVNAAEWNAAYDRFEQEQYLPLVPYIASVYKLHRDDKCERLRNALRNGALGDRTEHVLPERYVHAREILAAGEVAKLSECEALVKTEDASAAFDLYIKEQGEPTNAESFNALVNQALLARGSLFARQCFDRYRNKYIPRLEKDEVLVDFSNLGFGSAWFMLHVLAQSSSNMFCLLLLGHAHVVGDTNADEARQACDLFFQARKDALIRVVFEDGSNKGYFYRNGDKLCRDTAVDCNFKYDESNGFSFK